MRLAQKPSFSKKLGFFPADLMPLRFLFSFEERMKLLPPRCVLLYNWLHARRAAPIALQN